VTDTQIVKDINLKYHSQQYERKISKSDFEDTVCVPRCQGFDAFT